MAAPDPPGDAFDLKPTDTPHVKPVGRAVVTPAMSPDGGPVVDPLVQRLRREEDVKQGGGMATVAGGAAIIVFGSFALALVLSGLFYLWFDSTGLGITGWTILFVLLCGVAVGLLLRPTTASTGADRYVAGAPEDLLARGPLDWPLLGPRLIVKGIRHAQGQEPIARSYFYDRCALLLRQMGKRGEQAPVTALLISEDETPLMLAKVINYLDANGWLGASSDKSRIWLSSKGRQVLMEMGVVPDTEVIRG